MKKPKVYITISGLEGTGKTLISRKIQSLFSLLNVPTKMNYDEFTAEDIACAEEYINEGFKTWRDKYKGSVEISIKTLSRKL